MSVIREYKGCKLNKKHSKIESYELGVVWSFIKKCNLNGAHDSLVDMKAQTDIAIHPEFLKYINKTKTYRTIENIFSASEQSELRKKLESSRDIHKPWEDLDERSDRWNPQSENTYTGFASGGRLGASNTIINSAKKTKYIPLAISFLSLFSFQVIQLMAKETNRYAYEDWVRKVDRVDRDGEKMKKKKFVPCKKKEIGSCHRADMEEIKFKITPGYIIAWTAVLIYHGAKHGGQTMFYWDEEPDGDTCAQIQNCMSRNAFEFMRRYIHFENNAKGKNRSHQHFDPLYKIRNVLTKVMKGIRKDGMLATKSPLMSP